MHQLRELNIGENCSLNLINNAKQDIPQDHWLIVGKKRRVFRSLLLRNLFDWITHTIPGVRPAGQPSAVQIRSRRICPGCLAELGPRNDDEL